MDLIYKPNRFNGLIHKTTVIGNDVNLINMGDIRSGNILDSVKSKEENKDNKVVRSIVQKMIDQSSINGDQNIKKHMEELERKTKNAPVPQHEVTKTIYQNVEYKDIILANMMDKYNKYNGDMVVIPAVKKKANEHFKEWSKNVNQSSLANVDNIKGGDELIKNSENLLVSNDLFELPENIEDIDINKTNLIPTQLKEIKRKIKNQILEEAKESKEAKQTLNIPGQSVNQDYDNLAGQSNNMGIYNKQPMKTYNIGNY